MAELRGTTAVRSAAAEGAWQAGAQASRVTASVGTVESGLTVATAQRKEESERRRDEEEQWSACTEWLHRCSGGHMSIRKQAPRGCTHLQMNERFSPLRRRLNGLQHGRTACRAGRSAGECAHQTHRHNLVQQLHQRTQAAFEHTTTRTMRGKVEQSVHLSVVHL